MPWFLGIRDATALLGIARDKCCCGPASVAHVARGWGSSRQFVSQPRVQRMLGTVNARYSLSDTWACQTLGDAPRASQSCDKGLCKRRLSNRSATPPGHSAFAATAAAAVPAPAAVPGAAARLD
ncbi:hypothetical protein CDD82_1477 [Ophiocordyceps australis]|uniref:Uncharacterized protein n=1 Tax=Ophiocordyceps australis TaxID=1399860 RepID=A0A2C5YIH2_9HYPO|nr:hypothetical protein CDD82_1477 [Ophiocordyceps australis]